MTEQKPFGAGFPLPLSPRMSTLRSGLSDRQQHSGLPPSSYNVFLLLWTALDPLQLIISERSQFYFLITKG